MTDTHLIDDCLFCKIIRGDIPSIKLYEDERTYAFMDVMPQSEGHMLVIPKFHAEDLHALPIQWAQDCLAVSQRLANAAKSALQADGVMTMQLNGAAAGQTVFHYHQHVIPRYAGVDLKLHAREMTAPDVLAPIADKIKAAL